MAGLRIVKMSGAGNDFVVLGPEEAGRLAGREREAARSLCRRGMSVGADGLVLVEVAGSARVRVRVRFHNPDGSSAFCGNGSRCAARFAYARGLAGREMLLETAAGEVAAEVTGDRVRLTLPPPRDEGEASIEVEGASLTGRRIRAGVPHFVVAVLDPRSFPLARWGPLVHAHTLFAPEGTNLDLVGPAAEGALAIRTWERGVERETLACGSGAVAAAFAARRTGGGRTVRVLPASGVALEVELPGRAAAPDAAVLTGDARFVFDGILDPEADVERPPG